eukprot:TRINITY_DN64465_c0_g1_i1.p7 TRINITY_DN64465_c0_g1~~TRINITY_DN64465_c0_g1_i1.p7  ORF type:complete len:187 (-),score=41.56 TRINITY_DN64465_c0_g1_i1:2687-3247(-)
MGGNYAFTEFLQDYQLLQSPALLKYQTKAAEYYRFKLRSMVEGVPFDVPPPPLEEGKKFVSEPASISLEQILTYKKDREPIEEQQESAGIESIFVKVVDSAKEIGAKTKDVFEEAKIGDKMKIAGNAIAEGTKTAGLFIYDKTKIAANAVVDKGKEWGEHPAVKNITEKTREGLSKATDAISNVRK